MKTIKKSSATLRKLKFILEIFIGWRKMLGNKRYCELVKEAKLYELSYCESGIQIILFPDLLDHPEIFKTGDTYTGSIGPLSLFARVHICSCGVRNDTTPIWWSDRLFILRSWLHLQYTKFRTRAHLSSDRLHTIYTRSSGASTSICIG